MKKRLYNAVIGTRDEGQEAYLCPEAALAQHPSHLIPHFLRRLQVPCAQFEPLIHDNEGDAKSRERHVVQYQPWLLRSIMWLLKAVHVGGSLDLDLDRVHVWCNIVRQPLLTINNSRREPE